MLLLKFSLYSLFWDACERTHPLHMAHKEKRCTKKKANIYQKTNSDLPLSQNISVLLAFLIHTCVAKTVCKRPSFHKKFKLITNHCFGFQHVFCWFYSEKLGSHFQGVFWFCYFFLRKISPQNLVICASAFAIVAKSFNFLNWNRKWWNIQGTLNFQSFECFRSNVTTLVS